MVRLRNLLWTLIIAALTVSMVVVLPISGSSTKLSVEPPSFIDKNLVPDKTFSVNINLTDVVDLTGYEFKLRYDPRVVNATALTIGTFFSQYKIWVAQIYWVEGYVHCAVSLPIKYPPLPGVSGSGTLATIAFAVVGYGESVLDLYETELVNSKGYPIPHEAYDGYFSNMGLPPVAVFTFEPELPVVKTAVRFDASDSYDPDGRIVSYAWDFGDGAFDSGVVVDHIFEEVGIYTVTLIVTDNNALIGKASATIKVIPPKISKADLAEWMAKPEHRRFNQLTEQSKGEDLINAFYAEVQSLAYNPVTVKIQFTIYDGRTGQEIANYKTSEFTLTTYLQTHIFDTSKDLVPPQFDTKERLGEFHVKAQCFYWDPDVGDWVGGEKVKTFGFRVVIG